MGSTDCNQGRGRGRPAGDPHRAALNLRLDPGTIRRLKLHALIKDTTCSEVVIALVRDHLPDVRIDAPGGEV
jgi:hypothetical protein